jgi:hypothetical protein
MTSMSSSGSDSTFAAAVAAYGEAARRDPRHAGFGYLAGDPATGATGMFVWFATPDELLGFLQSVEIELLRFDEADARRVAGWLARAIGSTRNLKLLDREALSSSFEGWCEILWIGTFSELCEQGGPLLTSVRRTFRRERGLGEHAGPIGDDETDAFVAFLRSLGDDGPDPGPPDG